MQSPRTDVTASTRLSREWTAAASFVRGSILVKLLACVAVAYAAVAMFPLRQSPQDRNNQYARDAHDQLRAHMEGNNVWMSAAEQLLITSYLTKNTTMLEWGSGYSTLWFSQFVGRYYSIEHDAGWYAKIQPNVSSMPAVQQYVLKIAQGAWVEDGSYEAFKDYVHAVDGLGVEHFDVVLVDGRARGACAAHILKYITPDSVVFIHDYWTRLRWYKAVVVKYYNVIAAVHEGQTLVALRRKPNVNGSTTVRQARQLRNARGPIQLKAKS